MAGEGVAEPCDTRNPRSWPVLRDRAEEGGA